MNALVSMFRDASHRARGRRDLVFRACFPWIGPETRILDLGSGSGVNFARVVAGLHLAPSNVYAADMSVV